MSNLPGLVPGIVASLLVALGFGRRVARALGSSAPHAGALVFSLGVVASWTLTPFTGADTQTTAIGACDLHRMTLAPWAQYLSFSDPAGNVLLFVPLGLCLGWLRPSRQRAVMIASAAGLPVVIEATQLLVPVLNRSCESGDVVDNLTGLAIGLVCGEITRRIGSSLRHLLARAAA